MERKPLLSDQDHQTPPQAPPSSLLKCLYTAHFLARWGTRMWEFSVGLYMISVWPDSLLLAAIYGAVESASTASFGPIIGRWVDRLSYVKVLQLWLVTQNLSFIIAGGAVLALLVFSSLKFTNLAAFITLVILTNVSGAVGVLSTLAGTILIERECFVSLKASAVALAMWTTICVWVEYWLFMSVYNGIPALGVSSLRRISKVSSLSEVEGSISASQERNNSVLNDEESSATAGKSSASKIIEWVSKVPYIDAWRVYLRQDVVLPGVALALLFFTVLRFGTLMTATLEWKGIPAYVIGIARGISALIGIAATVVYPKLQSHILTLRTGLWSVWSQWFCLLPCVASIWIQNSQLSAYVLMGGVAISRLGLWMFDLSVIQQMQDLVPESDRCIVGGVQNSLQSTLDLMGYVMGIIISNPQDFWKLNLISFLAVTMAAYLYTYHLYQIRKHVFHFEKLSSLVQW